MSLKRLSYKTAEKIIEIYADLLMKDNRTIYQKFGYSELQGYDIIDVDNALKLQLAYRVFNTDIFDEKANQEFELYVNQNNNGLWHFFLHFVPDEIVPSLDQLDPDDNESMLKSIQIEGDYQDSEQYKRFQTQENQHSFLQFCIAVGNKDVDYWEKVYKRLNLVWDERDKKDPIYYCITNKDYFHKHFSERRNNKLNEVDDPKNGESVIENLVKPPVQKKSNKNVFFYIVWYALLIGGIYNSVLQKIAFIIIACLIILSLSLNTFKFKWEKSYNIFLLLVLILGTVISKVGIYVLVIVLFLEVVKEILFYFRRRRADNVLETGGAE